MSLLFTFSLVSKLVLLEAKWHILTGPGCCQEGLRDLGELCLGKVVNLPELLLWLSLPQGNGRKEKEGEKEKEKTKHLSIVLTWLFQEANNPVAMVTQQVLKCGFASPSTEMEAGTAGYLHYLFPRVRELGFMTTQNKDDILSSPPS